MHVTHCVSAFGVQSCIKHLKCIGLDAYGMARLCNLAEKVCTFVYSVFTDVQMLLWCTHRTTLAVCVQVQYPAVPHYEIKRHNLI
jgi:hypothetical protein